NSYKIIAGTNHLLARLTEGESEESDQVIAENLYLRSLMYFYLTNVFGRPYDGNAQSNLSVPLKLVDDPFDNLPRNTVNEEYDQIEKDLLKAERLFTDYKWSIYGSIYSTQTLMTLLYLYKG